MRKLSLEDAVASYIQDGTQIMFGGFTGFVREPMAFAWEIVRQGYKNLINPMVNSGFSTWLLHSTNAIRIKEDSWVGCGEIFAKLDLNADRCIKTKSMLVEDYAHGQMQMRLLAGALGVPFMPYWGGMGSEIFKYDILGENNLRDGKLFPKKKYAMIEDPFYDQGKVPVVPALQPEVGVIHAQKVGNEGTVRVEGLTGYDKELAFACKTLIVTCEEVVPEISLREQPQMNLVPFSKVDVVVEMPWGAYPTQVPYYYDYDPVFMREADRIQRDEEMMNKWLEEWVYTPKDWKDVMDKIGGYRLSSLTANRFLGYSLKNKRGEVLPPEIYMPLQWRR